MSWILQKMEKRAVIFPPLPSKAFLSLGFIGTLRLVRGCSCSRMCESYTKTEVEKHVTYFDRTAGSSCQLICTCGVITVPYITLHKSREGFSSKSLHPSSDQTSSDRMILEDQLRSDFFFFYDKLDCFVGCSVTRAEERESCSRPHEWAYNVLACQVMGFPGGASGKEPARQSRSPKRRWFNPWVRKIPRRRAWQPTTVLLPRESHGQRSLTEDSPRGDKELDTTETI